MQHRPFGKLGFDISALGAGLMRMPTTGESGELDMKECVRMVHREIELGINYFDTAYVYHGGHSETILAHALTPDLRQKIKIATKLPTSTPQEKWEETLDTSLKRMNQDYIDFYLLHGIRWKWFEEQGDEAIAFLERMVDKGKIRYPSFSFHDGPEAFKKVIDKYKFKMAQVQFNFMDEAPNDQAGLDGIKYAAQNGVSVVVMEPLRGGALAGTVPPSIQKLYDDFPVRRTSTEWALRYVYDIPEVTVVLSGMSTMEQIEENAKYFENATTNCMDASEHALIKKVRDEYLSRVQIGCTGCNYCQPCPQGVLIPDHLRGFDRAHMFDNMRDVKRSYGFAKRREGEAARCVDCGICESACPQHLPIMQHLKTIVSIAEG